MISHDGKAPVEVHMQLTDQEKADLRADMTEAARKMDEVFEAIEKDAVEQAAREKPTSPKRASSKLAHTQKQPGYNYPCLHCGYPENEHKASTANCPYSRKMFTHYDPVKTYIPNLAKPRAKGFTI